MDELINLITTKTGISEEQAQQVVTIVISFRKEKLPAPIATQVDNFLTGGSVGDVVNLVEQQLGNLNLGGLFGKE